MSSLMVLKLLQVPADLTDCYSFFEDPSRSPEKQTKPKILSLCRFLQLS